MNHIIDNIMIPFIPTAGDQLTMTCNITVPDLAMRHTPTAVIWSYDQLGQDRVVSLNTNATVSNTVRIGDSFFTNLTISTVMTSDSRKYYCVAAYGPPFSINAFAVRDLSVKSKSSYSI